MVRSRRFERDVIAKRAPGLITKEYNWLLGTGLQIERRMVSCDLFVLEVKFVSITA